MFLQQVREFAAGDHIKPQFSTPLVVKRRPSLPSSEEKKVGDDITFKVPDPNADGADEAAGAGAKPKAGSPRSIEVDDSLKARALKVRVWLAEVALAELSCSTHSLFLTHSLPQPNPTQPPKIYDKFIKPGAKFEINISSKLRGEVTTKVKAGRFDLHMFDNSYNEVSDMIKKDAFPRFKKSKEYESYKKLAGAKMHLRRMTVSQMDFPIGVL